MATPIRWDTINRRPSGEAGQALNSAAALMNSAFGQAQEGLRQHDTIDAANWQVTKQNNTNEVMKSLLNYGDAASYEAARKDGTINKMISQFGAQADQQALLKAADERMGVLQQRDQQSLLYNHAMTDERVAPLMNKFKAATLKGGPEGQLEAAAAIAEYEKLGGRDLPGLISFADTRGRQLIERDHADKDFTLGQDKGRQEIAKSKADIGYQQGMLGVAQTNAQTNREQLGVQREQMRYTQEDRLVNQLGQAIDRMGKSANLSPGSPEGQAKINDYIDKIKDPDIQSNARKAAAQMSGVKDMTVAGVLAGLTGVDKRDWFVGGDHPILSSNGNNIEEAVKRGTKFINSPDALNYQKRQEVGYGTAVKQYQDIDQRLNELRQQLYRKK